MMFLIQVMYEHVQTQTQINTHTPNTEPANKQPNKQRNKMKSTHRQFRESIQRMNIAAATAIAGNTTVS